MEAQLHTNETQVISHLHASGEMFEAGNMEAARGMCPVLGKMSLEEAGLLLELEAMGKEPIVDQPDMTTRKPVIEKIQLDKSLAGLSVRKISEPSAEEAHASAIHKIAEPKLHDRIMHKDHYQSDVFDVPSTEHIYKTRPEARSGLTEFLEAARLHEERRSVAIISSETITSSPVALEQTQNFEQQQTFTAVKHEAKNPKVMVVEVEKPEANALETSLDSLETVKGINHTDIGKEEAKAKFNLLEADEDVTSMESSGQDSLDIFEDEEVPSELVETFLRNEDESLETTQFEAQSISALSELPATIVQIEGTMMQLVDVIEQDISGEPGKIDAILETIITLPAKLESTTSAKIEALAEKLETLFIELLEEANINFTPEIVESFVKLTKAHYLDNLVITTKDTEAEFQGPPDEIGTREFLQKLQHGLGATKGVVINFCEIGKSILRLYGTDFQTIQARA